MSRKSHKWCFPKSDRDAVIVAVCRTPIGRFKGALSRIRPEDLGAVVVGELLKRTPHLDPNCIDDIIFGCAFPEAQQGMNIARNICLLAKLPVTVPGLTINRFCSSGLQAISLGADRIKAGGAKVIFAGGVESMSIVPMMGNKFDPHPTLLNETQAYISMIGGADVLQKRYNITREKQDEFAFESHRKAIQAQGAGKFREEIIPLKIKIPVETVEVKSDEINRDESGIKEFLFEHDEGPRRDTSLEKLAKLNLAVKELSSTVTAGNASQMSDGAAAVALMSRKYAKELGIKPLARLIGFEVTALQPELYGIGPVAAIPKVLRGTALDLSKIGLVELNEAFAVQALAVIHDLSLNQDILNVNGGAIALGHPLGCTGARIAATLIHEMRRRGEEFGLETMCIGGGMGAAGIFQLEE